MTAQGALERSDHRGRWLNWALVSTLLIYAGCEGSPANAEEESGGPIAGPCDGDERSMTYSSGLSVESADKLFQATLLDASPAPPARHLNEWSLVFALPEASTGSFDDIEIEIFPWMPDHGHGSAAPVTIEAGTQQGSYTLSGLDLHMAGYWEIHFELEATDASWSDRATFAFCVE